VWAELLCLLLPVPVLASGDFFPSCGHSGFDNLVSPAPSFSSIHPRKCPDSYIASYTTGDAESSFSSSYGECRCNSQRSDDKSQQEDQHLLRGDHRLYFNQRDTNWKNASASVLCWASEHHPSGSGGEGAECSSAVISEHIAAVSNQSKPHLSPSSC